MWATIQTCANIHISVKYRQANLDESWHITTIYFRAVYIVSTTAVYMFEVCINIYCIQFNIIQPRKVAAVLLRLLFAFLSQSMQIRHNLLQIPILQTVWRLFHSSSALWRSFGSSCLRSLPALAPLYLCSYKYSTENKSKVHIFLFFFCVLLRSSPAIVKLIA